MTNKLIYQISLTMINGVGDILARHLLETFGDPEAIFSEKKQTLEKVPGIGTLLAAEIKRPEVFLKAEQELAFIEKNNITPYFLTDNEYPERLKQCPDAPVLFYFKGNANLNQKHIISIVGTRHSTDYGRELTAGLIDKMASLLPDTLIVSGLAYGIDICAHRNALKNQLATVAVLAHGLDRIYPSIHRNTAVEMLPQGGLLTDFPSKTEPDKPNFVKRNRIVAGLADATIVIESADKGGSLITADIAFSYGRDVFTFPGRVTDTHSKGCHLLVKQNKAGLITSAEDLISAMRWDIPQQKQSGAIQTELSFPEREDFTQIQSLLNEKKELHINQLALHLDIAVHQLSGILFEMEMNGIIKTLPGNIYALVKN
ncbi:DNA-processing protein DprA [Parabacteroides chinchillae]|uniref:DNA processing protein n=1 Tax=Parabacteroides chinchillae TaxID=871327 RepID=A0A8G2BW78_9BACT|nr:DNA-processing protein DprA [Parabacteroides chinchillae]SEF84435.1 DNA processing protein [Parabacteroides chinchillae]